MPLIKDFQEDCSLEPIAIVGMGKISPGIPEKEKLSKDRMSSPRSS